MAGVRQAWATMVVGVVGVRWAWASAVLCTPLSELLRSDQILTNSEHKLDIVCFI